MKTLKQFSALALALAVLTIQGRAHESEVHVGRNASNQIVVELEFEQPLELEPSVFPGITGHATGFLGIHSNELDDSTNDFFSVSSAADFRFVLLAKDDGMEVWNDSGSGFMNVGDSFFIGTAPFDTHPIWNLVTNAPPGEAFSLTLKVRDLNGIYSDSEPFQMSFTAMEIPQLEIQSVDQGHAQLLWPTNAVEWVLESSLSPRGGVWNTVTNVPDMAGENFSLTITTSAEREFFRLKWVP